MDIHFLIDSFTFFLVLDSIPTLRTFSFRASNNPYFGSSRTTFTLQYFKSRSPFKLFSAALIVKEPFTLTMLEIKPLFFTYHHFHWYFSSHWSTFLSSSVTWPHWAGRWIMQWDSETQFMVEEDIWQCYDFGIYWRLMMMMITYILVYLCQTYLAFII